MSQPTLKRKDLHAPFFPSEVFEDYFNPKRNKKGWGSTHIFPVINYLFKFTLVVSRVGPRRVKLNLEELGEEGEEVFLIAVAHIRLKKYCLCRKNHLMNAQKQALRLPNQTTTLMKNMTMTMLTTISTMEKGTTWMIWGVGEVMTVTVAVFLFKSC